MKAKLLRGVESYEKENKINMSSQWRKEVREALMKTQQKDCSMREKGAYRSNSFTIVILKTRPRKLLTGG